MDHDYNALLQAAILNATYEGTPRAIAQQILHDAELDLLLQVADVPDEPLLRLRATYDRPDALFDQLAYALARKWLIDYQGHIFFVTQPDELLFSIEAIQAGTAIGRLKYREGQPLVQVIGVAIDNPRWMGTDAMFSTAVPRHRYAVRLQDEPPYRATIFQVEDYEIEPVKRCSFCAAVLRVDAEHALLHCDACGAQFSDTDSPLLDDLRGKRG